MVTREERIELQAAQEEWQAAKSAHWCNEEGSQDRMTQAAERLHVAEVRCGV